MKTFSHVPIMKTGEYDLSTGPAVFTATDLASAAAAVGEAGVKDPRLKIGHLDGRFDGEPAFGKFINLSRENNGHTLYGDLIGVPDWLAAIMPIAFPNRSVEGYWDFQPVRGGKKHPFVLTAVSLLGVALPGISTLEDLEVAFTGEPDYTLTEEPEEVAANAVAAFRGGKRMKRKKALASFSVEDVRRAFYEQVSTGDRNGWWAREIQIDPQQVIVQDENEGTTYRVPYAAGTDDAVVEFADPVKVKTEYVDIAAQRATKLRTPLLAGTGTVFSTPEESRPEGEKVTRKNLCASLGLKPTATDEEIAAKHREILAAAEDLEIDLEAEAEADDESDEESDEDEDVEAEEDDEDAEAEEDDEPVAAKPVKQAASRKIKVKRPAKAAAPVRKARPSGSVVVDAAALADLQSKVAKLAKKDEVSEKERQKGVVAAAIAAGKIPPAREKHWTLAMKHDPEGTEEILAEMAEIIPITARGNGNHDADESAASAELAYDPALFPEIAHRAAQAAGGEATPSPFIQAGTVMRER
jgi:Mu-like prophage I protein